MRSSDVFLPSILAVLTIGCSKPAKSGSSHEERLRSLERRVEQQRQIGEAAVEGYVSKVQGQLGDLNAPTADILRQLPGVANVEVLVATKSPTNRIIHLRDWHYVPPDLFANDVRTAASVDDLYREHLLQVELVSIEQESILRCLVRHHGLRQVLAEGLTPSKLPAYREVITSLRDTDRKLADLKSLRDGLKKEAPEIDQEIDGMVRGLRRQLLEYGAAGTLAIAGQLEVWPLDYDELLERAKPVTPDGKVKVDEAAIAARHDGQVKAAIASGPCSFIILGGAHDLSESVERLGAGKVEYILVTTTRFKEVAGNR